MSTWEDLQIDYPEQGVLTTTRSTNWQDSMITGNGTIGVIVPGNIEEEQLVISHERLFLPYNPPMDPINFAPRIEAYRRMIENGQADECARTMWDESGLEKVIWTDPFVPAFRLGLTLPDVSGEPTAYLRKTDYSTGVVTTCFDTDGRRFKRECFVSRADDVAVVRIGVAVDDAPFRCLVQPNDMPISEGSERNIMLQKSHSAIVDTIDIDVRPELLTYKVRYKNQWPERPSGFAAGMRVITDGTTTVGTNGLEISEARSITVILGMDVPRNPDQPELTEVVDRVNQLPGAYDQLLASHVTIHKALYDRVSFSLNTATDKIETDQLFPVSATDKVSNDLVEQTFRAARYITISSTGKMPPNLQGVWTGTWCAPWSGDYTMNGNVNTAIASGLNGNFPEVTLALCSYMERLMPAFRKNAQNTFGCGGILVPGRSSNTGLSVHFMDCFPHHFWVAGNGWYAQYFFDYWQYTQDEVFLKERAIPFMLEAAQFYEEYVYLVDGKVRFCPSYSPENRPLGQELPLSFNATMDIAAMKELFRNLISLRDRDDIPNDRVETWERLIAAAPEYTVDETGAFKEWLSQDIKENQKHRHASQLYPLYNEVDPDIAASEELQQACRQTIEQRLVDRRENNGGMMAFGLYQLAQAAANLKDADHAEECIQWMSRSYWSPAFTCYHNPGEIFNTDICGGLPAAIIQTLMQSSLQEIELLPALPKSWPNGKITGIRARGGVTLDIEWRDGTLQCVALCSNNTRKVKLNCGPDLAEVELAEGETVVLNGALKVV